MVVLDEQLLGRSLEDQITAWYRGAVCFISDLQPYAVIKDESIPKLLQQEKQATFITINERDFWRKLTPNRRYCIVCFTLPDSRAREIPFLLRRLFQHPDFNTKQKRMGKIIRVSEREISYYSSMLKTITKTTF